MSNQVKKRSRRITRVALIRAILRKIGITRRVDSTSQYMTLEELLKLSAFIDSTSELLQGRHEEPT